MEKSLAVLFPGDMKKGLDIVNRVLFGKGFLATLDEIKDDKGNFNKGTALMMRCLFFARWDLWISVPARRGMFWISVSASLS